MSTKAPPVPRSCWQCDGCGYVVPANRITPRGGSPSLIKCGVCDGTGRIEAEPHPAMTVPRPRPAEIVVDLHDLGTRFPVGSRVFIRYALAGEGVQTIDGTVTGLDTLGLVCVDVDDGATGCFHPDILHPGTPLPGDTEGQG